MARPLQCIGCRATFTREQFGEDFGILFIKHQCPKGIAERRKFIGKYARVSLGMPGEPKYPESFETVVETPQEEF